MKIHIFPWVIVSIILLFKLPVFAEENDPFQDDGKTIYDYFTTEEIEETERELIIIGLEKAGYYNDTESNKKNNSQYMSGTWSWRDGIICITESNISGAFNHGHAGIMGIAPDYNMTYEAIPNYGVVAMNGNYPVRYPNKNVWQADVTSTSDLMDQNAATWAKQRIGYPYQFPVTLSNRSKFYCSHLVYAAYKDVTGVDLDTSAFPGFIHPFELFSSPQTTVTYLRYLHDVSFSK